MQYKCTNKEEWDKALERLLSSYTIFAPVENEYGLDYELISPHDIERISYNKAKPATSLKSFLLPVKENVTSEISVEKPRIILGVPNCDIEGLNLLDEIYLQEEFIDSYYRRRRENSILIASDCATIQEHCHCLSYNIKPYSTGNADIAVFLSEGTIILRIITAMGEDLIKKMELALTPAGKSSLAAVEAAHKTVEARLEEVNKGLPGHKETARLVREATTDNWEKFSSHCVSCGACITICPTCSCFLLIDKPVFEKVKQMDGCQYPGFERVAGGEDPLHELPNRFRNRYMCKYDWKTRRFTSPACTGCGRCIEACIGRISKNEIFMELSGKGINV
jgi:sulfhydrogenase subunit beta (sulfur reductase)